ncbi:Sentrin-specific protease 8 [Halotydeus destructor]|nr:Sentrin-specific protease 8 [Halotydeus destructor]
MASEGAIVLNFHDTLLRTSDVSTLDDGQWLNDNVIGFWFEYLEYKEFSEFADSVSFIGPQVAQFIKSAAENSSFEQEVLAVLSTMDLKTKQLILLPINDQSTTTFTVGGSHWTLLVYNGNLKSFEHFDSTCSGSNGVEAQSVAKILQKAISPETQFRYAEAKCNRQTNGFDCGIHLIVNAENVCEKVLRDNPKSLFELSSEKIKTNQRKRLIELINTLNSQ